MPFVNIRIVKEVIAASARRIYIYSVAQENMRDGDRRHRRRAAFCRLHDHQNVAREECVQFAGYDDRRGTSCHGLKIVILLRSRRGRRLDVDMRFGFIGLCQIDISDRAIWIGRVDLHAWTHGARPSL